MPDRNPWDEPEPAEWAAPLTHSNPPEPEQLTETAAVNGAKPAPDHLVDPAALAPERVEPIGFESLYAQTAYAQLIDVEPAHGEPEGQPARSEPALPETVEYGPVQYEPVQYEPVQYEPVQYEPVQYEPVQHEPVEYEPQAAFSEPVFAESAYAEVVDIDPPWTRPQVEPAVPAATVPEAASLEVEFESVADESGNTASAYVEAVDVDPPPTWPEFEPALPALESNGLEPEGEPAEAAVVGADVAADVSEPTVVADDTPVEVEVNQAEVIQAEVIQAEVIQAEVIQAEVIQAEVMVSEPSVSDGGTHDGIGIPAQWAPVEVVVPAAAPMAGRLNEQVNNRSVDSLESAHSPVTHRWADDIEVDHIEVEHIAAEPPVTMIEQPSDVIEELTVLPTLAEPVAATVAEPVARTAAHSAAPTVVQPPRVPAHAAPEPPSQPSPTSPSSPSSPTSEDNPEGGRRLSGKLVASAAMVVVLLAAGALAWVWFRGLSGQSPQIGSCFEASIYTTELSAAPKQQTVDCADPKAAYRVVGIVENKKSAELSPNTDCAAWQSAVVAVWLGDEGQLGRVYCVEEVNR